MLTSFGTICHRRVIIKTHISINRVDPKVAAAGIEVDLNLLTGCSDLDLRYIHIEVIESGNLKTISSRYQSTMYDMMVHWFL